MTPSETIRAFAAAHDLAIYTATWCPDCRRLKDFFDREGILRREVSIETDPDAADRLVAETGKRAIPFILVDGRAWVRGYHKEHPNRLDAATLAAELAAASG